MRSFGMVLFVLISVTSAQAATETACEALVSKLRADSNLEIVRMDAAYKCGPAFEQIKGKKISAVDGCAILFQNKGFRTDDMPVLGYLDRANNLSVNWAVLRDGDARGWSYSGRHFGADVKTYFSATMLDDGLNIRVSRETARDALSAPIRKTFVDYTTRCGRIANF